MLLVCLLVRRSTVTTLSYGTDKLLEQGYSILLSIGRIQVDQTDEERGESSHAIITFEEVTQGRSSMFDSLGHVGCLAYMYLEVY